MEISVFIILGLEGIFALLLLFWSHYLKDAKDVCVASVLLLLAFALRAVLMSHETLDYQNFLTQWVTYFKDNGGFAALASPIGNYNVPYMYFLAAFSYLDIKDLYLIKTLSILFDILLAWASSRIIYRYARSSRKALVCFFIILLLPTVVLNGAYWGQCDSIFTAFAVLSIMFALDNKPAAAMCSIAVSFAFKLQAVFIMPIFVVFLIGKKVKLWHFLLFPLTYLVIITPAVLFGMPFSDAISLYFSQAGTVGGGLNYNSSSVFSIITDVSSQSSAASLGILAAFLAMGIIIAISCFGKVRLSSRSMMAAALLFAVAIPFLLPHMHDRYFFIADTLSVIYACMSPGYFLIPVLVQFASMLGYWAYLQGYYILPMQYGGFALIIVIAVVLIDYICSVVRDRR